MYNIDKHYSTIKPFYTGSVDLAVSNIDIERAKAYNAYDDFYYNRPETLKVQIRGDSLPIYLPSSRKIVEATNRFLAKNFNFAVSPNGGSPQDQAMMRMFMTNLFQREEFYTKFAMQKRHCLTRGDEVWHITADDTKEQGSRISIHTMHPASYHPIEDPNSPGRLLGCHLVEIVQHPQDPDPSKKAIRRQTYRRVVDGNGRPTGPITSELTTWEIGAWDDRNLKPDELKGLTTIKPLFTLPPQITSIPVYHIRNNPMADVIFGFSQLAGIETIVNGLNQAITDEDLTLVMQGLGMYWTTAGAPQNADGSPAPWNLGPGQVIEVGQDQQFGRVTGVSSVAPMVEHMNFMDGYMQQGIGIPDIAAGRVDVAVAESGISLKLQLAPIIAANEEKELEKLAKMDHMLWDISRMWMPAYEGINLPEVEVVSVVDDPMPINREQRIQEVLLLQQSGLITIAMAQAKLGELGYEFSPGDDVKVVEEAQALANARSGDPFNNRFGQDTEPDDVTTPSVGQPAEIAAQTGMPSTNGAVV